MESAPNHALSESLLAAMPQLREKPRLGFKRNNPALNPGHIVCNSTTTLGVSWSVASGTRQSVMMGRFMSPDPLPWIHWQNGNRDAQAKFGGFISNPQNFNMYAYVLNNPLNKTDPTGMNACGTNNDSTCHVTITIKDRSTDSKGNYNDQFSGLKGQSGYNATATVSVTGTGADGKAFSASGTFLAKTTPDDSGKSGTIMTGTYSATLTMHHGEYSAILLGTVPTVGPNPRQGGQDFATSIEMHKSGLNGTAVASDPNHPISMGCQTIYRDQYSDFQSITGLEPSAGSRQGHFTVDVDAQANQLNIAQ